MHAEARRSSSRRPPVPLISDISRKRALCNIRNARRALPEKRLPNNPRSQPYRKRALRPWSPRDARKCYKAAFIWKNQEIVQRKGSVRAQRQTGATHHSARRNRSYPVPWSMGAYTPHAFVYTPSLPPPASPPAPPAPTRVRTRLSAATEKIRRASQACAPPLRSRSFSPRCTVVELMGLEHCLSRCKRSSLHL